MTYDISCYAGSQILFGNRLPCPAILFPPMRDADPDNSNFRRLMCETSFGADFSFLLQIALTGGPAMPLIVLCFFLFFIFPQLLPNSALFRSTWVNVSKRARSVLFQGGGAG